MEIILDTPCDMHLHLRDGEVLENVLNYTTQCFSTALVMPNLNPPITSLQMALDYKKRILEKNKNANFTPLMSLFLSESLSKDELKAAKESGVMFLKLYPKGSTTGSESGVSEILNSKVLEILEIAQELGLFLSIHGESKGFVLDREVEFHTIFEELAKTFPKLKIFFEHLSDRRSIAFVEKYPNLFATLTLHHITLSLDDVIGGALNPHLFCKPILKTKKDQEALLEIALKAHPKFSFGSDCAPHLKATKESGKGAAGIFSAPILLPALAELFEKHQALENLETFVCKNAHRIYNLNLPQKLVKLIKKPMKVEEEYSGIVPLRAGECISWSLA
ncbi:dihydroorotase [Helicobacter valdiviensis]|uniref:Dihydroorotase n=1 Tax=Helicobacter valdiviensis TaxID=1458358 RepID=A0A2W6MVX3_9HELI|nr:dihydroorotase [Helicobacter valdiviensis]PZT48664.1 dihydroorotase [Helicobacter valdiviensis]